MITKIFARLMIVVITFGLVACVSLNSHQTGRTQGKGNSSAFANFNFGYFGSEQYYTLSDSGAFYITEIGTYYGVKNNLDLGFKVNSSSLFTAVGKYQFIGNDKSFFASSVGGNVGFGPFGLLVGVLSYSGSVSLFNSIHFTDKLAFTLSPQFSYLEFANLNKDNRFTDRDNIYGYSAGFILGSNYQFSFELSQYVSNTKFSFNTSPIFSIGFIWNMK
jgi:hypothetical protein